MGKLSRCTRVALVAIACAMTTGATLAAAPPANADSAALVAKIGRQLGEPDGIRTHFVQTRTVAAMKAPLVSAGTLLFVRASGVIWQIDTPYPARYVITDAGVAQIGPDGRRTDSRSANGVAQVSSLMRSMLGGDMSALYSQFDVHADGTLAQWHLRLTPTQPQIAQAIDHLEMAGGTSLKTLQIAFRNGDGLRLDFADTVAVSRPTAGEAALFDAARR